ncbi:MAG: AraC family transcriptional regulator, partial [Clostridia bacterium]|nr:AraC family transcriptional regulator [Clostridia bacterium]
GLPPYEYALTRRIEHAMTLLAGSSVPIADIAAACGFVSLSSFNKAFRKIAGIPPREYRSYRNS